MREKYFSTQGSKVLDGREKCFFIKRGLKEERDE